MAGGTGGTVASAEIYDPVAGSWTVTGSLSEAHGSHTATLLPDGRVLVAAGSASAVAEIYDPTAGNWSVTGSLNEARRWHTASLLPDGRVLVAGGYNLARGDRGYLASAEIYDPVAGTWSTTGSLNGARDFHTATLLPDGRVLVTGGGDADGYLDSVQFYDPVAGSWSATLSLTEARGLHTATLLSDGRVLVAGGTGIVGGDPAVAEIYTFSNPPADLVVTDATDSVDVPAGPTLSLREAIRDAGPGSCIGFDPTIFDGESSDTIVLGGTQLTILKDLTIDASDLAGGLTIDGADASRIFRVAPSGSLTVRGLTLTGGSATGSGADAFGGAILNEGVLNVQHCLLTGNEAQKDGGAISGGATISNSTFVDNAAQNGAAVVMSSGSLEHCTITSNRLTKFDTLPRGAVFGFEADVTLANCVIAENEQFDVVSFGSSNPGVVRFEGQNIAPAVTAWGTQGSLAGPTPLTSSPALMLLGNYGGPTLSRPPLPWSPAIDSGIVLGSPLANDQRGAPRSGASPDLGAVEYQPALVDTASDQNDLPEGPELSLREALARPFVSSVTFDPAVFNGEPSDTIVLTNGELLVEQSISMLGHTVGGVTVDANGASTGHRVLHISDTVVSAELWNMHFTGGTTPPNPELNGEFGGGILNEGTLILNSCSVYGNTTGSGATGAPGGGIYNSRDLSIRGGSIHDNTTGSGNNGAAGPGGDGGGIFNAGFLEIQPDTIIRANATGTGTPRGNGGGIANIGELEVTQSTLAGNQAGRGGGIWNELGGSLTVEHSTIHSNSCDFAGGGIRNGTDSDATIVACTLVDNTAGNDAGAVYAGGTVEVVSSTIVGNRAVNRDAGGVFVAESFSIRDSIVADNEAPGRGPDLVHRYGPGPVALGVNLLSDLTDSSLTAGPSIIVGDPLLAPLGDYGGPTLTMPPLPGSPAFDAAGTTNPGGTDQRGLPRFVNGALDIGAVEFQGALELNYYWPTDWDGDGRDFAIEFTLGTDPLVPDLASPKTPKAIGGSTPGIQFGLNRDFLPYLDVTITRSYDLQGPWTPIATFDQSGNFQGLVPNLGFVPFTEIPGVVRVNELQPESDRAFYRIETTPRP